MMLTYGFSAAIEDNPKPRVTPYKTLTVFHRLSFEKDTGGGGRWSGVDPIADNDLTSALVAERFRDTRQRGGGRHWTDRPGAYTAGQMPYTLVIRRNGLIEQSLHYTDLGPHALSYSAKGLGIAVVGDHRYTAPTAEQLMGCIEIGALLHAFGHEEAGHTELDGGANDDSKVCPGVLFGMDDMRIAIRSHVWSQLSREDAGQMLVELGVLF